MKQQLKAFRKLSYFAYKLHRYETVLRTLFASGQENNFPVGLFLPAKYIDLHFETFDTHQYFLLLP